MQRQFFYTLLMLGGFLLSACAPQIPEPSPGHLGDKPAKTAPEEVGAIPPPVSQTPYVPPPAPRQTLERYTVVVDQVPARELLFALARDAELNIDVHPEIAGVVTINAIQQTMPQILDRVATQVSIRYRLEGDNLSIVPDSAYLKHYQIGYVNMARDTIGSVKTSTQVVATGSGDVSGGSNQSGDENNSQTGINNISFNRFWESLVRSVATIIGEEVPSATATSGGDNQQIVLLNTPNIIANPEGGLLTVRANQKKQTEVGFFLDRLMRNVQRQVLIEATIVEVQLSDQYQAGVDWQRVDGDFSYGQDLISTNLASAPAYTFTYTNPSSALGNLTAALKLLEQFGNVKVLSSPKLMVLNNQTALLKVVDNRVYFEVNARQQNTQGSAGSVVIVDGVATRVPEFDTEIRTVPEGVIINVTPQISENHVVTLNVRPTISRIIDFVNDPNPALALGNTVNSIPVVQVREVESILRVNSGKIAVIGGLMQDSTDQATQGLPALARLPLVGDLFSYRNDQYRKSELAIFLKPTVIRDASLEGDLHNFRRYLPDASNPDVAPPTGLPLNPDRVNQALDRFGWPR
ncbi:MAG: type II and III secretion system protein [Pseudomonadota bacterium]